MPTAITTCVILCVFRNDDGSLTAPPQPKSFYDDYFFDQTVQGVGRYYNDVTNSEINIVGQTFGWFDIGHTLAEHNQGTQNSSQRQRAFQWGIDAAMSNGIPLGNFPNQVVFVNFPSDHGALGLSRMLVAHGIGADFDHTFVEHEFGHVLGLEHSWSTPPDIQYGDDYCIMSAFTSGFRFNLSVEGVDQ